MTLPKLPHYNAIFRDDRYHGTVVRAVTTRWLEGQDSCEIAKATGYIESHVANVIARFQDRRHAHIARLSA